MGFIERLRQEQTAKLLTEQQLKALQEVSEAEKLQREAVEKERRALRRQQAERFREESRVSDEVAKLGEFLAAPTIPVIRRGNITDGGDGPEYTEYVGRGSYQPLSRADFPNSQKDPDSVFDTVRWDNKHAGYTHPKHGGSSYSNYSEKCIAVESCPDGTIVFHGGFWASTTIRASEWRTKDKEQIFDKALEKAYKNPGVNLYSVSYEPARIGNG